MIDMLSKTFPKITFDFYAFDIQESELTFKDDESKELKTKRKQLRNRVEKKRPKCPDGYVINHQIGLCQRKGSKNSRKYMTKQRTYKAKTFQRISY